VRRRAPLVSCEPGCGKTLFHHIKKRAGQHPDARGSSPAPWQDATGKDVSEENGSAERMKQDMRVEPMSCVSIICVCFGSCCLKSSCQPCGARQYGIITILIWGQTSDEICGHEFVPQTRRSREAAPATGTHPIDELSPLELSSHADGTVASGCALKRAAVAKLICTHSSHQER